MYIEGSLNWIKIALFGLNYFLTIHQTNEKGLKLNRNASVNED